MSVRVDDMGTIRLEGVCGVEDAEQLLIALRVHDGGLVDISALTRAHMAVAQLLAIARRPLIGTPEDNFTGSLLLPALKAAGGKDAGPNGTGI